MKIVFYTAALLVLSLPIFGQDMSSETEKFEIVDDPAVPEGGYKGLYNYFARNLRYPKSAKRQKLEGKVYVQFVIGEDGFVDQETIELASEEALSKMASAKTVLTDHEYQKEALRLIKNMPRWKPPMQRGKAVRQRIVLPITFGF